MTQREVAVTAPTGTNLSHVAFDPELTPGALNAVRTCLRIEPTERVTVITDEVTSVAISADGKYLLSGSNDQFLG